MEPRTLRVWPESMVMPLLPSMRANALYVPAENTETRPHDPPHTSVNRAKRVITVALGHRGLLAVRASTATNLLRAWNQAVIFASLGTTALAEPRELLASLVDMVTKRLRQTVQFVSRASMVNKLLKFLRQAAKIVRWEGIAA